MNIRVGYGRQHTQGLHKSLPTLVPHLSPSEEGRARSRRGPNHPYETQVETSYPEAYRSPEAVPLEEDRPEEKRASPWTEARIAELEADDDEIYEL